ncbi:Sec-independent protein translocase TatB [Microbacterium paludicola]|uniref:Sec-independent protein translocase TatB n=1 Tax=Microbacterium paludicola TaxID=300019 RepID=UPI0031D2210B
MNLGLTFEKVLVIAAVAAFLIGPERLPRYAEMLARLVRRARDFAQGAQSRVREEMGPEFDEVDWRKLDPRQYDPRRIIREALLEDETPAPAPNPTVIAPPRPSGPMIRHTFTAETPPPFDAEAT